MKRASKDQSEPGARERSGRDLRRLLGEVTALLTDAGSVEVGPRLERLLRALTLWSGADSAHVFLSRSGGQPVSLARWPVPADPDLSTTCSAFVELAPWDTLLDREALLRITPSASDDRETASLLRSFAAGELMCVSVHLDPGMRVVLVLGRHKPDLSWPADLQPLAHLVVASMMLAGSGLDEPLPDGSQRLYATIVNTVREGIWMLDSQGRTQYVNQPMADMLGFSPEELHDRPVFEFMDSREARDARRRMQHVRSNHAASYERAFLARNGRQLWTRVSVAPRTDARGRYLGSVALVTDISDRKRREVFQSAQRRVLEMIAANRSLAHTMKVLVGSLEEILPECSVMLVLAGDAGDAFEIVKGRSVPRRLRNTVTRALGDAGDQAVRTLEHLAPAGDWVRVGTARIGGERTGPRGCLLVWSRKREALEPAEMELLEDTARFALTAAQHEKTQADLRENEERFRTLVEHAPDGIVVIDAETSEFVDANENIARMLGLSRAEIIGRRPWELSPERQPDGRSSEILAAEKVAEAVAGGEPVFEWVHRRSNGELFPTEVRLVRLPARHGVLVRGSITDITERRVAERNLRFLATRDQLTHLCNRTLFLERLEHAIELARRHDTGLAVLFIDLDRFKYINDNLGHSHGDRVLAHVADSLRRTLRESDTIARLGGDEFTVLLEGVVELQDAAKVAKKVRDAIGQRFKVADDFVSATPSIGISIFPKDGRNAEELLKAADTAMYRAKELGGNGYQFYTAELNRRASEFLQIERDLHVALDEGQLILEYQPKVELQSGRTTGAEALMRWHHPERGLVSPGDFIPVAEDTGLIVPMGKWALERACTQALIWAARREAAGLPPFRVSVNLSARQLRQGQVDLTLERVLEETGLHPRHLELEVTESMIIRHSDHAVVTLDRIRAMGVYISVDDFGTGYSSLGYLKRLPIDAVKIDRSFIKDLTGNAEDRAIVSAVIAMAHALDLKVVAEGVEEAEQYNFLKSRGCDEVQGYLISRPAPAREMERWLLGSWTPQTQ
ncbi:MAG: EAL domain-containing protein [Gammaproteobacteria bacterium]|jgi:diguanylate cyclase (GGDEF)-like protein/PAS domain S-box-containing protein